MSLICQSKGKCLQAFIGRKCELKHTGDPKQITCTLPLCPTMASSARTRATVSTSTLLPAREARLTSALSPPISLTGFGPRAICFRTPSASAAA
jgi:hypothetical protein